MNTTSPLSHYVFFVPKGRAKPFVQAMHTLGVEYKADMVGCSYLYYVTLYEIPKYVATQIRGNLRKIGVKVLTQKEVEKHRPQAAPVRLHNTEYSKYKRLGVI